MVQTADLNDATDSQEPQNFGTTAEGVVMVQSTPMPEGSIIVQGPDMNNSIDISSILRDHYAKIGFQATVFGEALRILDEMITWRSPTEKDPSGQPAKCTIFLGYTSNMISSGVREVIRFLVQNRMVDCVVTSAGGVEEDFIKCMAPTYMLGTWNADGEKMRQNGMNRIGNLVVPNENYCMFEDWLVPILNSMLEEQKSQGTVWSPSSLIHRLGKEINNPDSVYYWCYKNNIPVFCPGLTDGSLGDIIFFHSYKNPGLIIDLVQDIRAINSKAMSATKSGIIILGGGLIKHHILNANLMRNGADYAVFVNTGQEFDGSDSGASPEEAVSWGKLRATAKRVKICADATLIFPLLVAETFGKHFHSAHVVSK